MNIPFKNTQFGFNYGGACVTRAFSDSRRGWVTLMLTTKKHPNGIQIYVTKTGKVRIFSDMNKEWKP